MSDDAQEFGQARRWDRPRGGTGRKLAHQPIAPFVVRRLRTMGVHQHVGVYRDHGPHIRQLVASSLIMSQSSPSTEPPSPRNRPSGSSYWLRATSFSAST